jgi:hypothetical protein
MRNDSMYAAPALDLRSVLQGWTLQAVSVGPEHDPIVLACELPQRNVPSIDQPLTRSRIFHSTNHGDRTIELDTMDPLRKHVQPLGRDTYLVVDFWSFVHGAVPGNARIYDAHGSILRSFYAGGCAQHVQTTTTGSIWVGFGDQGVFNWRQVPDGGEPAWSGLVSFDADGTLAFQYSGALKQLDMFRHEEHRKEQYIVDCYALNVASYNEVWVYYYSAFPLVRIANGVIDKFYTFMPIHGAHAFAVHGNRVLFAGSYDKPHTLFSVTLDRRRESSYVAVDQAGKTILFDKHRSFGRGSRLYLVTEEMIYVVDLAAL